MGSKERLPEKEVENRPETLVICLTCQKVLYDVMANNKITQIVAEERALDHKRFWPDHDVRIITIDERNRKI